jgi:hypothetical protein
MPGVFRTFRRPRVRRLAVACALAQYLLVASGVPVPVAAGPVSAEAYPCQGHNCGCRGPEHCWRSCCCHTHEQRLAWARENNVTPPAYVLRAPSKPAAAKPKCSHCCSKPTPSASTATVELDQSVRWVSFIEAERCHAGASNWVNLPWSSPPPQPLDTVVDVIRSEPIVLWAALTPVSLASEPAEPPPRLG